MTTSVYDFAEKAQVLLGPYTSLGWALRDLTPNATLFVDKRWLQEFTDIVRDEGVQFEPSSIEAGLLGHIGYIGKSPVVTNKFTDKRVLPADKHQCGFYVALHTREERKG